MTEGLNPALLRKTEPEQPRAKFTCHWGKEREYVETYNNAPRHRYYLRSRFGLVFWRATTSEGFIIRRFWLYWLGDHLPHFSDRKALLYAEQAIHDHEAPDLM